MTSSKDLSQAARDLLSNQKHGTLASMSIKLENFPFCSSMPYAVLENGKPVFFVSSMATHTRNLKANPRASLLISESSDDPLANGRLTLIGTVEPLPNSERDSAAAAYLESHPNAKQWIDFGDFAFFQLTIADAYLVAGFGTMGWVGKDF
jgi:putative heme iron utilization protein